MPLAGIRHAEWHCQMHIGSLRAYGPLVIYPRLRLLSHGEHLCSTVNMPCHWREFSTWMLRAFNELAFDFRVLQPGRRVYGVLIIRPEVQYSSVSLKFEMTVPSGRRLILDALCVVQRQVRLWLFRRQTRARLAVAMAYHPRLGSASLLHALDVSLVAVLLTRK